jgi:hypothetical protein
MVTRAERQELAERPTDSYEDLCVRASPRPVCATPSGLQPSLPLRLQADTDEGPFFTDGPFIETKS